MRNLIKRDSDPYATSNSNNRAATHDKAPWDEDDYAEDTDQDEDFDIATESDVVESPESDRIRRRTRRRTKGELEREVVNRGHIRRAGGKKSSLSKRSKKV